jgi:hypothetical protein
MDDVRRMQIGQLVDFCIDYNERQKKSEAKAEREQKHGTKRRATQNDINAFFG